ncbi:MAG: hypothetical protein JNM29_11890 [Candidatus Odyssella sp.]|nr:hypothetical protein [Candidatus Odyssella sp.]
MRIVHADEVPYKKPRTNHREGDIEFKRLMQGKPGGVQNFEFLIAKTGGRFFGPRHRHNFEQIRLGLSGALGKNKDDTIAPGQIGYYPENCYYQIDSSDSEIVLIQFAGPSGWGYLSYDQLYAGSAELAKLGTFKDGVFFRNPGTNLAPGQKKNQDGYEAIWEHVYGRPIEYPKPRYEAPVLMNPDNYPWLPDAGAAGVARRHIASFSERRIEIAQIRLDAGARTAETAPAAPRFLFVTEGTGSAGGTPVRRHSLVELSAGERAEIAADAPLVALTISLPAFGADEIAFFEERNRRKTSAAA